MNKLKTFFLTRYGGDELNIALLTVWLLLSLGNSFARNLIVRILCALIGAFVLYRMLSPRTSVGRAKENALFRKLLAKCRKPYDRVAAFFRLRVKMWKERRTHRYVRCPSCRSMLRLPYVKGEHTVRCPHCGERFEKKL